MRPGGAERALDREQPAARCHAIELGLATHAVALVLGTAASACGCAPAPRMEPVEVDIEVAVDRVGEAEAERELAGLRDCRAAAARGGLPRSRGRGRRAPRARLRSSGGMRRSRVRPRIRRGVRARARRSGVRGFRTRRPRRVNAANRRSRRRRLGRPGRARGRARVANALRSSSDASRAPRIARTSRLKMHITCVFIGRFAARNVRRGVPLMDRIQGRWGCTRLRATARTRDPVAVEIAFRPVGSEVVERTQPGRLGPRRELFVGDLVAIPGCGLRAPPESQEGVARLECGLVDRRAEHVAHLVAQDHAPLPESRAAPRTAMRSAPASHPARAAPLPREAAQSRFGRPGT